MIDGRYMLREKKRVVVLEKGREAEGWRLA
jgi:hypothetical protein